MGIIQLPIGLPAQVGIFPSVKRMATTDSLSTVTTAGYLNSVDLQSNPISPSDILEVIYSYNQQTNSGTFGIFTVSVSNGVITLTLWANPGDVLLPVTSGDYAVFNGATGQIKDSGSAPSAASQPFVVVSPGSLTSGHVAKLNDANGTLADAGYAAANVQLSALSNPDNISDLIWHDVPVSAAALASGGTVTIQASSGSKQYIVRDIRVNYTASGLSGGSGNRLIIATDGTLTFNSTGITAALLGTPINTVWGGSGNPLTSTLDASTPSTAGANILFKYAGGSADYTTGSVSLSVLTQRVA